jgi:hypothetical protein
MKYFTPQLWRDFNSPHSKAAFKTWDRRFKAYRENLKKILPGLPGNAQKFFRDALILHDGTLTRMEVGDLIGDAARRAARSLINNRRTAIRLFVLSDTVGQRCYILNYTNLERVELNLPGKIELFPIGMHLNFGDWGYDELTSPKPGIFRHEILFASSGTIIIEFRKFSFRRTHPTKRRLR